MSVAVRRPAAALWMPRRADALLAIAVSLAVLLTVGVADPVSAAPTRHVKLERFALELVNCTRTGGWVRVDGTCKAYGTGRYSRYRRPLPFHDGIADDVAYPWAVKIARNEYCGHSLWGSSVSERFTAAGYTHRYKGESVGCSSYYRARRMVIRTHRKFQAERSWNGWHWRNIKDPDWRSVGIGIATVGAETRVVYDFYGARPPGS